MVYRYAIGDVKKSKIIIKKNPEKHVKSVNSNVTWVSDALTLTGGEEPVFRLHRPTGWKWKWLG